MVLLLIFILFFISPGQGALQTYSSPTESDMRLGTAKVTIIGGSFVTTFSSDQTLRNNVMSGVTATFTTMFAKRRSVLVPSTATTSHVYLSGTDLVIQFDADSSFDISAAEVVTVTLPGSALSSGSVNSVTFTIQTTTGSLVSSSAMMFENDIRTKTSFLDITFNAGETFNYGAGFPGKIRSRTTSDKNEPNGFINRKSVILRRVTTSSSNQTMRLYFNIDPLYDITTTEVITIPIASDLIKSGLGTFSFALSINPSRANLNFTILRRNQITASASLLERSIRNGGATITLTLPYGETFDRNVDKSKIQAAFKSRTHSGVSGAWDDLRTTIIPLANIVIWTRNITIKLAAAPNYDVMTTEQIGIELGSEAVVSRIAPRGTGLRLTIAPVGSRMTVSPSIMYERDIIKGGNVMTITLLGEKWLTSSEENIRKAFVAYKTVRNGFNQLRDSILKPGCVTISNNLAFVRFSGSRLYDITRFENITLRFSSSIIQGSVLPVGNLTLRILPSRGNVSLSVSRIKESDIRTGPMYLNFSLWYGETWSTTAGRLWKTSLLRLVTSSLPTTPWSFLKRLELSKNAMVHFEYMNSRNLLMWLPAPDVTYDAVANEVLTFRFPGGMVASRLLTFPTTLTITAETSIWRMTPSTPLSESLLRSNTNGYSFNLTLDGETFLPSLRNSDIVGYFTGDITSLVPMKNIRVTPRSIQFKVVVSASYDVTTPQVFVLTIPSTKVASGKQPPSFTLTVQPSKVLMTIVFPKKKFTTNDFRANSLTFQFRLAYGEQWVNPIDAGALSRSFVSVVKGAPGFNISKFQVSYIRLNALTLNVTLKRNPTFGLQRNESVRILIHPRLVVSKLGVCYDRVCAKSYSQLNITSVSGGVFSATFLTEDDVRSGSAKVTLSLFGDVWTSATDGLVSWMSGTGSDAYGFNSRKSTLMASTVPVRRDAGNTQLIITFAQDTTYDIAASEYVMIAFPRYCFGSRVVPRNFLRFEIRVKRGVVSISPNPVKFSEAQIRAGGQTFTLTLSAGERWIPIYSTIQKNLTSTSTQSKGWNQRKSTILPSSNIILDSATVLRFVFTADTLYDISSIETIRIALPKAALASGLIPTLATGVKSLSFNISQNRGTVSPTSITITEAELRSGGKTMTISLSDDSWVLDHSALLASMYSSSSEPSGWNAKESSLLPVGSVTVSGVELRFTFTAVAAFDITKDEVITMYLDRSLFATKIMPIGLPIFLTIKAAVVSITSTRSFSENLIRTGGAVITISLLYDTWNSASRTSVAAGICANRLCSDTSLATGWNSRRTVILGNENTQQSYSGANLILTLVGDATYDVCQTERIYITLPATCTTTYSSGVTAPTGVLYFNITQIPKQNTISLVWSPPILETAIRSGGVRLTLVLTETTWVTANLNLLRGGRTLYTESGISLSSTTQLIVTLTTNPTFKLLRTTNYTFELPSAMTSCPVSAPKSLLSFSIAATRPFLTNVTVSARKASIGASLTFTLKGIELDTRANIDRFKAVPLRVSCQTNTTYGFETNDLGPSNSVGQTSATATGTATRAGQYKVCYKFGLYGNWVEYRNGKEMFLIFQSSLFITTSPRKVTEQNIRTGDASITFVITEGAWISANKNQLGVSGISATYSTTVVQEKRLVLRFSPLSSFYLPSRSTLNITFTVPTTMLNGKFSLVSGLSVRVYSVQGRVNNLTMYPNPALYTDNVLIKFKGSNLNMQTDYIQFVPKSVLSCASATPRQVINPSGSLKSFQSTQVGVPTAFWVGRLRSVGEWRICYNKNNVPSSTVLTVYGQAFRYSSPTVAIVKRSINVTLFGIGLTAYDSVFFAPRKVNKTLCSSTTRFYLRNARLTNRTLSFTRSNGTINTPGVYGLCYSSSARPLVVSAVTGPSVVVHPSISSYTFTPTVPRLGEEYSVSIAGDGITANDFLAVLDSKVYGSCSNVPIKESTIVSASRRLMNSGSYVLCYRASGLTVQYHIPIKPRWVVSPKLLSVTASKRTITVGDSIVFNVTSMGDASGKVIQVINSFTHTCQTAQDSSSYLVLKIPPMRPLSLPKFSVLMKATFNVRGAYALCYAETKSLASRTIIQTVPPIDSISFDLDVNASMLLTVQGKAFTKGDFLWLQNPQRTDCSTKLRNVTKNSGITIIATATQLVWLSKNYNMGRSVVCIAFRNATGSIILVANIGNIIVTPELTNMYVVGYKSNMNRIPASTAIRLALVGAGLNGYDNVTFPCENKRPVKTLARKGSPFIRETRPVVLGQGTYSVCYNYFNSKSPMFYVGEFTVIPWVNPFLFVSRHRNKDILQLNFTGGGLTATARGGDVVRISSTPFCSTGTKTVFTGRVVIPFNVSTVTTRVSVLVPYKTIASGRYYVCYHFRNYPPQLMSRVLVLPAWIEPPMNIQRTKDSRIRLYPTNDTSVRTYNEPNAFVLFTGISVNYTVIAWSDNPNAFEVQPYVTASNSALRFVLKRNVNVETKIRVYLRDLTAYMIRGVQTSPVLTVDLRAYAVPYFVLVTQQVTVLEDSGTRVNILVCAEMFRIPKFNFRFVANFNKTVIRSLNVSALTGRMNVTVMPDINAVTSIELILWDVTFNRKSLPQQFTFIVQNVNDAPLFNLIRTRIILMKNTTFSLQRFLLATNMSAGGYGEATQKLSFRVEVPTYAVGYFAVQPSIDSDGYVTFQPNAVASGLIILKVVLDDDGGVLNGGTNTSSPQYFSLGFTSPWLLVSSASELIVGSTSITLSAQNTSSWAIGDVTFEFLLGDSSVLCERSLTSTCVVNVLPVGANEIVVKVYTIDGVLYKTTTSVTGTIPALGGQSVTATLNIAKTILAISPAAGVSVVGMVGTNLARSSSSNFDKEEAKNARETSLKLINDVMTASNTTTSSTLVSNTLNALTELVKPNEEAEGKTVSLSSSSFTLHVATQQNMLLRLTSSNTTVSSDTINSFLAPASALLNAVPATALWTSEDARSSNIQDLQSNPSFSVINAAMAALVDQVHNVAKLSCSQMSQQTTTTDQSQMTSQGSMTVHASVAKSGGSEPVEANLPGLSTSSSRSSIPNACTSTISFTKSPFITSGDPQATPFLPIVSVRSSLLRQYSFTVKIPSNGDGKVKRWGGPTAMWVDVGKSYSVSMNSTHMTATIDFSSARRLHHAHALGDETDYILGGIIVEAQKSLLYFPIWFEVLLLGIGLLLIVLAYIFRGPVIPTGFGEKARKHVPLSTFSASSPSVAARTEAALLSHEHKKESIPYLIGHFHLWTSCFFSRQFSKYTRAHRVALLLTTLANMGGFVALFLPRTSQSSTYVTFQVDYVKAVWVAAVTTVLVEIPSSSMRWSLLQIEFLHTTFLHVIMIVMFILFSISMVAVTVYRTWDYYKVDHAIQFIVAYFIAWGFHIVLELILSTILAVIRYRTQSKQYSESSSLTQEMKAVPSPQFFNGGLPPPSLPHYDKDRELHIGDAQTTMHSQSPTNTHVPRFSFASAPTSRDATASRMELDPYLRSPSAQRPISSPPPHPNPGQLQIDWNAIQRASPPEKLY